jgi:ATP phosphoribosyltransferase regulatory subunit
MAVEALYALGIKNLSIDIALPTLVPAIISGLKLDDQTIATLRAALDRKDEATLISLTAGLGKDTTCQLTTMLRATGPAEAALTSLAKLNLPEIAASERSSLESVINNIRAATPELNLTVDLVESRGLEYHTGVTFTIFAKGIRGELGRGGRYLAGSGGTRDGEPATGMTLFMDSVLRAVPATREKKRLYLPTNTNISETRKFRSEGWITVDGLKTDANFKVEANRLRCSHFLSNGTIQKV